MQDAPTRSVDALSLSLFLRGQIFRLCSFTVCDRWPTHQTAYHTQLCMDISQTYRHVLMRCKPTISSQGRLCVTPLHAGRGKDSENERCTQTTHQYTDRCSYLGPNKFVFASFCDAYNKHQVAKNNTDCFYHDFLHWHHKQAKAGK